MIVPVISNSLWVRGRLLLCALFSGTAGLIYEVLWNRNLLLVFGSTTYSAAGVLAAFMGGLALGAMAVSRWGARIRSPLTLYAILEGSIALYAIALNQILDLLNRLPDFHGVQLLVGGVSILLPTIAMGAGLPLLAFGFDALEEKRPSTPGMLYGFNTLGAVMGAIGAGFLFLPRVGMQGTLYAGIFLSMITAGLGLSLNIQLKKEYAIPHSKKFVLKPWQRVFVGVLLLSGACSLGYEVIWTRVLILIIGSSTYAFSLTVAVFILGTSLGSLYMGRKAGRLRSTAVVFSHIQAAIGLLAVTALYFYGRLPGFYLRLFDSFHGSGGIFIIQVLLIGAVMLPPTFLMGASFPLAVWIVEEGASTKVGKPFSLTFGWVSAGNVFGVLAVSLLLIPTLGLQGSIVALALGNVGAGLIVATTHPTIRYRLQTISIAVAGFIVLWIFQPKWEPIVMTSGVYAKAPIFRQLAGSDTRLQRILDLYRLQFYREGVESVVSVVQMPTLGRTPYLALAVDGKVDASTGRDMSTQILSGHLPFIFHPTARDVLVIGLASGITVGSVSTHPVRNITCVEIEPSMKEAARMFDSFNNGVLDDPRVGLIFDDGRHYLGVAKRTFDLIISEPSNPWMSGPSRLFTIEFFQIARSHLNPGGLFAQWLPLYGLGSEHLRSLARSFIEVFPHSVVFRVSEGDLLLIGNLQPLAVSTKALEEMFQIPGVRADLERIGIELPGDLLSHWMGASNTLVSIGADATLNTDDNGLVEFGAPDYLHKSPISQNLSVVSGAYSNGELGGLLRLNSETKEWVNLLLDGAEASLDKGRHEVALELAGLLEKEDQHAASGYLRGIVAMKNGDIEKARGEWNKVLRSEPWGKKTGIGLAELEVQQNDFLAADSILGQIQPQHELTKYHYLKGIVALHTGRPVLAQRYFQSVSEDSLGESRIFMPFFRWLVAVRMENGSLAERYGHEFVRVLSDLRRAAERDERLTTIDLIAETLGPGKTGWLEPQERERVEYWLRTELFSPLENYFQGVGLLFGGQPEQASVILQEAGESLRESDPGSMIFYYLAVAQQKNSPETALGLLNAFATGRTLDPSGSDWLAREVSLLISELNERVHRKMPLKR